MNKPVRLATSISSLVLLVTLTGGCTNEQKIAKSQDLTPQIEREASDLIAKDAELKRFPIVVDGFKGDMRLKGSVATAGQKARAEKIVWAVPGVKSVENYLLVNGKPGVK